MSSIRIPLQVGKIEVKGGEGGHKYLRLSLEGGVNDLSVFIYWGEKGGGGG